MQILARLPRPTKTMQSGGRGITGKYKQFPAPGKPAAEVSYKKNLTYRSAPVLSTMRAPRVPQSDA